MSPTDAFVEFASRVLVPAKAERFRGIAFSEKAQRKVLDDLCHRSEGAILESAKRGNDVQLIENLPCFAFHASCGFGKEFPTVREAMAALGREDGWLIVVSDGSAGVYRPEARWDGQVVIVAE